MSITATNLPEWTEFERDYIISGIPHLFVVRPDPNVSLFVDQYAGRIGARFATTVKPDAKPTVLLTEIHVDHVVTPTGKAFEIWTDAQHLYCNFYQLICEIVSAVVDNGDDPDAALLAAVRRWESLLDRPNLMSEEAQAGLFGEIWMLERLISTYGASAVDAWVGPARQPHDFRLGDVEFEVKTTSGNIRVHTINGIGQLQSSLGCSLYLLSLKLTQAGTGGQSLPEAIHAVEKELESHPAALERFRVGVQAVGYDLKSAHRYPRRRRLRDSAVLIQVADGVPRLTADALNGIPPRFASERIGNIIYSVNVDGMGYSDGSPEFHSILPPCSRSISGDFDV